MLVLFLLAYNYRKNIQIALELVKHSKAPRKNILLLSNILETSCKSWKDWGHLNQTLLGGVRNWMGDQQQISSLLDSYMYALFLFPYLIL